MRGIAATDRIIIGYPDILCRILTMKAKSAIIYIQNLFA